MSERGVVDLLVVVTIMLALVGAWVTCGAVASIIYGAFCEVRDLWRVGRASRERRREREGIHLDE